MNTLIIPEIGSELRLVEPWIFSLHYERRNTVFFDKLNKSKIFDEANIVESAEGIRSGVWTSDRNFKAILEKYFGYDRNQYGYGHRGNPHQPPLTKYCYQMTFPVDTILAIDRYYIKKNNSEFSSITFYASNPSMFKGRGRFWAKLHEVNGIKYEPV